VNYPGGFGSALFMDGKLVPDLEMAHHQFRKGDLRAAVGALRWMSLVIKKEQSSRKSD